MAFQRKRLFIENLPESFTKSDLDKRFNDYGSVFSVEIKQRKNATDKQTPHFAYIHIDIDPNSLNNCLDDFYNKQWNGYWVPVQEAKENFLERLKREREEVHLNGHAVVAEQAKVEPVEQQQAFIKEKVAVVTKAPKKNNFKSNSILPETVPEADEVNSTLVVDNDYIIMNNKNKTLQGAIKIESFGKEPVAVISSVRKKAVVVTDADKKRVQSLVNMNNDYQQKKLIIKNALSKIDGVRNNKIIFDDEADIGDSQRNNAQKKLSLFENEESDEEGVNLEIREQFEGRKGQKLLELQSKFKNDERFIMDSRFVEDGSEQSEREEENEEEMTIENEKQKEYEILESVLGQKVNKSSINKHKMMVRFDPSAPQHAKYELKSKKVEESSQKKRKLEPELVSKSDNKKEKKEEVIPEVSKETFYKVAVDFQEVLQEKQQFSLTSMFDQELQKIGGSQPFEMDEKPTDITKPKFKEKNPFKYDSSDDESEVGETMETPATTATTTTNPNKVWNEPFFFKEDDYRFAEGHNFLQRLAARDGTNFNETRRNFKEMMKSKLKNHERNNRPFRKKLGGNKRIRIKKALKR